MKKFFFIMVIGLSLTACNPTRPDEQTKEKIVQQSTDTFITEYPGKCPCPYNIDDQGKPCDRYSAYSKGWKDAPLCYTRNVSKKALEDYKS